MQKTHVSTGCVNVALRFFSKISQKFAKRVDLGRILASIGRVKMNVRPNSIKLLVKFNFLTLKFLCGYQAEKYFFHGLVRRNLSREIGKPDFKTQDRVICKRGLQVLKLHLPLSFKNITTFYKHHLISDNSMQQSSLL